MRHSGEDGIVTPRPSADDAKLSRRWSGWIFCGSGAVVLIVIIILYPFHNISFNVVNTPGVRFLLTHAMCLSAILANPADVIGSIGFPNLPGVDWPIARIVSIPGNIIQ